MPYTYSWRDKTKDGCLGSGLDDYPRDYLINDRKEIHVDLQSWMALFSNFMVSYADRMNNYTQSEIYKTENSKIVSNLES